MHTDGCFLPTLSRVGIYIHLFVSVLIDYRMLLGIKIFLCIRCEIKINNNTERGL